MSKLPEAVQRQVEAAEALERKLYGNQPEEGTGNPQPAEEPTPVAEPTPELPPAAEPAPEIQAKPGKEEDLNYWRSRANALFGVNQQQTVELQNLKEQVQALTSELSTLSTKLTTPVEQPAVDGKDAEIFGEDLVAAIDRRAQEIAKSQVATLREEIARLRESQGATEAQVQMTANDRFLANLSAALPDWEVRNQDVGFLRWLEQIDPVYGRQRQAALDEAAAQRDVARVVAIFKAYAPDVPPTTAPVRSELERQVTPTSTRGASNQPPAAKLWTGEEYESAQDPRNIASMGRERADALAAEAERALMEGRVRW
ncbi:MAG: hypothetical protein WBI41_05885 [Azovibrio sp.]|uniref:hypothetical protein n=1 Tax=Azovibrio sp. TaxID=1872673 RepID=UPI003C74C99E